MNLFPKQDVYSSETLLKCSPLACTYRAVHLLDNRPVAIKVLRPDRQSSVLNYSALQRLIEQIKSSPLPQSIIPIQAVHLDGSSPFIEMPYIDAETLFDWRIHHATADYGFLMRLAILICRALEALHKRDMIHGYPAPENIYIYGDQVCLSPFSVTQLTSTTIYEEGTSLYFAPEQVASPRSLDQLTDLYILGTTLFYLFTRQHYLGTDKNSEASILTREPLSLATVLGICPGSLESLLNKMLEKDPKKRPQSVEFVRTYLETLYEDYSRSLFSGRGKKIEQPLTSTNSSFALIIELTLTKRARRILIDLLKDMEMKFTDDRDHDLLNLLINTDEYYSCFLRYEGTASTPLEHRLTVIFTVDADNSNNQELLTRIGKQLYLDCVYDSELSGLRVLNIRQLSTSALKNTNSAMKLLIKFTISSSGFTLGRGIPDNVIGQLRELWVQSSLSQKDSLYWQYWYSYLNFSEKIANKNAYKLSLNNVIVNHSDVELILVFSEADLEWEKIAASVGKQAIIRQKNDPDHLFLCKIEAINVYQSSIKLIVDTSFRPVLQKLIETERHNLQLEHQDIGELVQIRRQKQTLEKFRKGYAANPRLRQFLLDPWLADQPFEEFGWERLYKADLLHRNLNQEQLLALEAAQNVVDFFLINGPPGTGKTTLIAELCYQFVRRGLRVLLSSQSNLAVDRAMSMLSLRSPLRPLRVGNSESIELDGIDWTRENVAVRWLEEMRLASIGRANNLAIDIKVTEIEQVISNLIDALNETNAKKQNLEKYQQQADRLAYQLEEMEQVERETENSQEQLGLIMQGADLQGVSHELIHNQTTRAFLRHLFAGIECLMLVNASERTPLISHLLSEKDVTILEGIALHNLDVKIENISRFIHAGAEVSEKLNSEAQRLHQFLGEFSMVVSRNDSSGTEKPQVTDESRLRWLTQHPLVSRVLDVEEFNELSKNKLSIVWTIVETRVQELLLYIQKSVKGLDIPTFYMTLKIDLKKKQADIHDSIWLVRKSFEDHLNAIKTAEQELDLAENRLDDHGITWRDLYERLFLAFPIQEKSTDLNRIYQIDFLESLRRLLMEDEWTKLLVRNLSRKNQLEAFLHDWHQRLAHPSTADIRFIKDLYEDHANIIGVTCGQVNQQRQQLDQIYDVAIIDEANRATPTELLQSLINAKKIILVGDHKQLPPLMDDESLASASQELDLESYIESEHIRYPLFGKLFDMAPVRSKTSLVRQYRMTDDILRVVNQFYNNQLRGGHHHSHLLRTSLLSPNISLAWISVPNTPDFFERKMGTSYYNSREIELICQLLAEIEICAHANQLQPDIGVMTFYRAQSDALSTRLKRDFPKLHLRIGTVDRFQGMEQDIVIVSFVRNNADSDIGFARSPERINVALSRARKLLVIVGCRQLFTGTNRSSEIYKNVEDVVREVGAFQD